MLSGYKNFQLSMFVTVRDIDFMAEHPDKMEEQLAFFRKHLKLNKLYLEYHRSDTVNLEKYLFVKDFFDKQGMEISAAFTPCSLHDEGYQHRISECLCYNNPNTLSRIKEHFETMAQHVDAILLDDYVFTNCTCDKCRAAKGERSWDEYRLELMANVCNEYMIKPAKAVNPKVKITLKYPTWHESYQHTGYNTEKSPFLFDEIYSGTETRNVKYSLFRNPRYTSYSLMKYVSTFAPYTNRGDWYDVGGDVDVVDMLEQAYLSLFADPREMTLYCWHGFADSLYTPAIGFELDRIDRFLGKIGKSTGIPVYLPHNSSGEDHIFDFLGMCALPVTPTTSFPEEPCMVGLTVASVCDPDLLAKVKAHLEKGGNVFVTSGCLTALQDRGMYEFTGLRTRNQTQISKEFGCPNPAAFGHTYYQADKDIAMQIVDFKLNENDLMAVQNQPAFPNPLLAFSNYALGRIYLLNVPEAWADLYHIPVPVLNTLRKTLSQDMDLWLDGPSEIALFPRDNHSCIIESFLEYGACVKVHVKGEVPFLTNVETGVKIPRNYQENGESVFLLPTKKSDFSVYQW